MFLPCRERGAAGGVGYRGRFNAAGRAGRVRVYYYCTVIIIIMILRARVLLLFQVDDNNNN